jgi:transposase
MTSRTKLLDRQHILLEDGQKPVYAAEVAMNLQNGTSIDEAANRLDVSTSHLRQWLRRNGYTAEQQPAVWKAASEEQPR